MRLRLIACNVFTRELSLCISKSPHVVDVDFTELGEHSQPERLRERLQAHIDATERLPTDYDAVCLAYGLCGNASVGLVARSTPLVIPRAHDCCTILLGSRQRYLDEFGDNPSQAFSSAGYLDRGDYYLRTDDEGNTEVAYGDSYAEYVARYGEENAAYLWEALQEGREGGRDKVVFIDIDELQELGHAERFRRKVEAEGRRCTCLRGDLRLLRGLVAGDWDEEDYLVVPPGHRTVGIYDQDRVIRTEPVE